MKKQKKEIKVKTSEGGKNGGKSNAGQYVIFNIGGKKVKMSRAKAEKMLPAGEVEKNGKMVKMSLRERMDRFEVSMNQYIGATKGMGDVDWVEVGKTFLGALSIPFVLPWALLPDNVKAKIKESIERDEDFSFDMRRENGLTRVLVNGKECK